MADVLFFGKSFAFEWFSSSFKYFFFTFLSFLFENPPKKNLMMMLFSSVCVSLEEEAKAKEIEEKQSAMVCQSGARVVVVAVVVRWPCSSCQKRTWSEIEIHGVWVQCVAARYTDHIFGETENLWKKNFLTLIYSKENKCENENFSKILRKFIKKIQSSSKKNWDMKILWINVIFSIHEIYERYLMLW